MSYHKFYSVLYSSWHTWTNSTAFFYRLKDTWVNCTAFFYSWNIPAQNSPVFIPILLSLPSQLTWQQSPCWKGHCLSVQEVDAFVDATSIEVRWYDENDDDYGAVGTILIIILWYVMLSVYFFFVLIYMIATHYFLVLKHKWRRLHSEENDEEAVKNKDDDIVIVGTRQRTTEDRSWRPRCRRRNRVMSVSTFPDALSFMETRLQERNPDRYNGEGTMAKKREWQRCSWRVRGWG